ncbi:MAG: CsbD family protein [Nitriliruptorales bacterium]|nr:CsbD family protein [Nitriliruptorales bacterium]
MTEHRGEEFKGRAKEAGGDLTGDRDLKREGKIDQSSAKAKDKISDVANKVKDAVTRDSHDSDR